MNTPTRAHAVDDGTVVPPPLVRRALEHILVVLASPACWTRGSYARSGPDTGPVGVTDGAAVCWCLAGAAWRAAISVTPRPMSPALIDALYRHLLRAFARRLSSLEWATNQPSHEEVVTEWNDNRATFHDVRDLVAHVMLTY